MKSFLTLTLVAFFALQAPLVFAQNIGSVSLDGIDIQMDPVNPAPGQDTIISVKSYTTNLNGASISWTADGKSFAKGVGLTSVHIQPPTAGKKVRIMATINTVEGGSIQKVVDVKATDIDLVWEADGYTPPLYRGKAPFSHENTIKVTAIPHLYDANGTAIDPKNLIYTWQQDSTVLDNLSGYGKQSISIKGALLARPFVVSVTVASKDASATGNTSIGVSSISPTIVFYESDPLYGILYNKAVGDVLRLFKNEQEIVAAPYGFTMASNGHAAPLQYKWTINGIYHNELLQNKSIVLRAATGSSGSSNVGLELQNTGDDIFQNATRGFTAIFSNTNQNNSVISF